MAEHNVTVESTLDALLAEKKYPTIRDILITMNPADIASVFDSMEEERLPLLFRLLPKELAAETFMEMEPDAQELLIRGFSDSELREVVDELYVDDAVDIVEEMPANVVRRILSQADPQMRKDINEILRYPENSAGSIMTTEYVSLRPDMTVEESILRIRRTGVENHLHLLCHARPPASGSGHGQGLTAGAGRQHGDRRADGNERHLRQHPDRPGRSRADALKV